MANQARKTEHSGAKKGKGAYWGRKRDAKPESNQRRREDDKESAVESGDESSSVGGNNMADHSNRRPRHPLGKLLRGITRRNVHKDVDTGGSIGLESW
jgi:hypothetical protein